MSEAMGSDPDIIPLEAEPSSAPKPVVCRMCFAKRIEKNAPCPNCGFDERAGLRPDTLVGSKPIGKKGLVCAKCGYKLQGLRSLRCPECGTVAQPPSVRDYDKAESRRIFIESYRTPLLMLLIGGGILFLVAMFALGPVGAGAYMLKYAVEVPIGLIVFLACCALWIGFDAPLHLTALRLAAIYTVVDLTYLTLATFFPILFLPWIITIVVYVGLLAEMLEMDWQDAAMVGVLTYVAKALIGIAIFAAMMG